VSREPIRTNVGVTTHGDNVVRGASVRDRLLLEETRWSLLSRLIDGPELSRADAAMLDDMLVAIACPDPRIWPLKVAWTIGSYGDWWAAHGAVTAMLGECRMGPWACAAASDTVSVFRRLKGEHGEGFEDAVVEWARPRARRREVIWGFGVAGGRARRVDERWAMVKTAMAHHGRLDSPHFQVATQGATVLERRLGLVPNAALAVGSIGLDVGMSRSQIEVLMYQVLGPQIVGNAYEASRLAPASLRALPEDAVEYVGPARRESARAREAGG